MEINKDKLLNWVPMALVIFVLIILLFLASFMDKKIRSKDSNIKTVTENVDSGENFEVVGIVLGTKKCVEHLGDAGGRSYVCFTSLGDVFKIKINGDGSQELLGDDHNGFRQEITRSKSGILREKRTHFLGEKGRISVPVFKKEYSKYKELLPEDIQYAVSQTLLSLET